MGIPKVSVNNNFTSERICPECNHFLIIDNSTNDLICSYCGIIHQENKLISENRRSYNYEEEKLKQGSGPFITILNKPLYSLTDFDPYVANNISCYRRLAKWDSRLNQDERNLNFAQVHLKRISSKLNIPKHVQIHALRIYLLIKGRNLIIGRKTRHIILCCIYLSCRIHQVTIFLDELIKESGWEDEGNLKKLIISLLKELNLKLPMIDISQILTKCINLLGLNIKIERKALELLRRMPFHLINGKNPKGIIGAVIFLVAKRNGIKLMKYRMAKRLGINEATIRNRLKDIERLG
ncbi:hypothetical protein GF385_02870 [Candidatus Dependentiae bacterium]|nr:hypothetical protein [Candidatus Dependentiae bacterium]